MNELRKMVVWAQGTCPRGGAAVWNSLPDQVESLFKETPDETYESENHHVYFTYTDGDLTLTLNMGMSFRPWISSYTYKGVKYDKCVMLDITTVEEIGKKIKEFREHIYGNC